MDIVTARSHRISSRIILPTMNNSTFHLNTSRWQRNRRSLRKPRLCWYSQLTSEYTLDSAMHRQAKKKKGEGGAVLAPQEPSSLLISAFCSEVSLVGNLMLNLILRFPFLEESFGIGIPSLGTTSS